MSRQSSPVSSEHKLPHPSCISRMLRLSRLPSLVLLLTALLVLGYLKLPWSRTNGRHRCLQECNQLLFLDDEGHTHVQPSYVPFHLPEIYQFAVINESLVHVVDQHTGSSVGCRYHTAQMAFFTAERINKILYGKYPITGNILLQMRHDAMIGLPGGGIRAGETIKQGLLRELMEEMAVDRNLTGMQYILSYHNPTNFYCGHLFAKQVTWSVLRKLAQRALGSSDTGSENMGYLFMPTLNEVEDDPGFDGLPTFLAQAVWPRSPPALVGNTLQQILHIMTEVTDPPILSMEHMRIGITRACRLMARSECGRAGQVKGTGATLSNFFQ